MFLVNLIRGLSSPTSDFCAPNIYKPKERRRGYFYFIWDMMRDKTIYFRWRGQVVKLHKIPHIIPSESLSVYTGVVPDYTSYITNGGQTNRRSVISGSVYKKGS